MAPRSIALAVAALLLGLTACSAGPNWPEVACSPDLDSGTPCVPGPDQRALELFANVSNEADAATLRMTDPLAAAMSTNCTAMATIFTVCVSSDDGITVITPIVMPENGRVSFTGSDLESIESIQLDEPLGLRRDTGELTVVIRDGDDAEVGTIPLGFYP